MNTKQGKLRRVLCVIGWVLLGIVTVGGLLFLLSRVKNLSLFKGWTRSDSKEKSKTLQTGKN